MYLAYQLPHPSISVSEYLTLPTINKTTLNHVGEVKTEWIE